MRLVTMITCLTILLGVTRLVTGQVVFFDDFADNSVTDGQPVKWITRSLNTGSYDVSDGDLIFKAGPDFHWSNTDQDSLAADPVDYVMSDTSVIAQIRGELLANMGIGARWNEQDKTGYYAGLDSAGLLFVGKCERRDACPLIGTFQTDGLLPNEEDVLLYFSAIGSTLNASAWRPGESMPADPQISLVDHDYVSGTPAIFANPNENGTARYRFVNVWGPSEWEPQGRFGNARRVQGPIDHANAVDGSPALSADGLELIFKSNAFDPNDLYRATRASVDDAFGQPELLTNLNSNMEDNGAQFSADELTLYFSSNRLGGFGDFDLYQATRPNRDAPFENVMNLGPELNTDYLEISPNLSSDGLEIFFASDRPGGLGGSDIWMARRESTDEPFGEPENLGANINSPYLDATPTLSPDGLHLLFTYEQVSNAELQIASRPSRESPFGPRRRLDEIGLGSTLHSSSTAESDPLFSPDWPSPGSKIYYTRYTSNTEASLWEATWSVNGDVDFDGVLTANDVNQIIRFLGRRNSVTDTNQDGITDEEDLRVWIEELKHTYFGDANLDGEFGTADFIHVFLAGEYEDELDLNSTWETGDWNGDREFTSADFVKAFEAGGFELGPRHPAAVPEPSSLCLLLASGLLLLRREW